MMSEQFIPHSHIPYGKDGSGYYSENTLGCFHVIRNSAQIVSSYLDKYWNQHNLASITLADYGTADGGTSLPLFNEIIQKIRSKNTEIPVTIYYEDQPSNDWISLHYRLQNINFSNPSYFIDFPNTFYLCSGISFYKQCFPPLSVDLGFSSTSMHWLTKKPCNLANSLHHTSGNEEENRIFAQQAKKDWMLLLHNRAKEIKEGGYLIIINFNVDEQGQFLGYNKSNGTLSMYDVMNNIWSRFVDEDIITKEEYINTNFINYYRSKNELLEPLASPNSEFTLQEYFELFTECPFHRGLVDGRIHPKDYADKFIPTIRSWSNSTFKSGLSNSRTEEDKSRIVDLFFEEYRKIVSKEPYKHSMDYFHGFLILKKQINF